MASERPGQPGQENTPEREILGTLDIANPDRPFLFNEEMVRKIAKVLGARRTYSTQGESPVWSISIGPETNYCNIVITSFERKEYSKRFIRPAHDRVWIYRYDSPPGKGWFKTSDSINGVTSVEIEGDNATFVQDVGDWELRYSIKPGARPEIHFNSKGRPTTRTVGSFSFNLDNSGGTRSIEPYYL